MTKYFVGQRVRVVCQLSPHHNKQTCVTAVGVFVPVCLGGPYQGIEVDIPCMSAGGLCQFEEHELEPILPSGHAPAEIDVHELLPFLKEGVAA